MQHALSHATKYGSGASCSQGENEQLALMMGLLQGPSNVPRCARCARCAQGVVTLVTMALPVVYSLVLLVRKESWASAAREKVELAKAQVATECYALDEGHPLSVPIDVLAVRARPSPSCPPTVAMPLYQSCPTIQDVPARMHH